jgi:hypothetical protein
MALGPYSITEARPFPHVRLVSSRRHADVAGCAAQSLCPLVLSLPNHICSARFPHTPDPPWPPSTTTPPSHSPRPTSSRPPSPLARRPLPIGSPPCRPPTTMAVHSLDPPLFSPSRATARRWPGTKTSISSALCSPTATAPSTESCRYRRRSSIRSPTGRAATGRARGRVSALGTARSGSWSCPWRSG